MWLFVSKSLEDNSYLCVDGGKTGKNNVLWKWWFIYCGTTERKACIASLTIAVITFTWLGMLFHFGNVITVLPVTLARLSLAELWPLISHYVICQVGILCWCMGKYDDTSVLWQYGMCILNAIQSTHHTGTPCCIAAGVHKMACCQ